MGGLSSWHFCVSSLTRRETRVWPTSNMAKAALATLLAQNPFEGKKLPRHPFNLLRDVVWPASSPFAENAELLFAREDESDDAVFYEEPRLLLHIDDAACATLTRHYERTLPQDSAAHLDLCSSWVSFLPTAFRPARCVGLGLNAKELEHNPVLTERVVQDLNKDFALPFPDNSFDSVTNVVSVDYMASPLTLFNEQHRVLKPGGVAIMSFSNRMFWTKAVRIWTQSSEWQRVLVCAAYFRFCGAQYTDLFAFEITSEDGHDPMFVVQARKPVGAQQSGL